MPSRSYRSEIHIRYTVKKRELLVLTGTGKSFSRELEMTVTRFL